MYADRLGKGVVIVQWRGGNHEIGGGKVKSFSSALSWENIW
jgi:hypothetical protein